MNAFATGIIGCITISLSPRSNAGAALGAEETISRAVATSVEATVPLAPASQDTLKLTKGSAGKSFSVRVGTRIEVSLGGGLKWSEASASSEPASQPVLARRSSQVFADGSSFTVFVVVHDGAASISAQARALCKAGEACSQFVRAWRVSIQATSSGEQLSTGPR